MNKKITLKEFFENGNAYIHCDTEEKAIELLKAFDAMGKTWCDGESYLLRNFWNNGREDTCYSNYGSYDVISYYRAHNYPVYEFEDIIDFTSSDREPPLEWNSLLKR